MSLTTNAKDWVAQNLGINNCMTETSIQFQYHDSVNDIMYSDSGGTATIFNALIDSACDYVVVNGTQYFASTLRQRNGGVDPVFPTDVQWVQANDSGTLAYCYSSSGGVLPPSEPTMDARVGTYEFTGIFCTGEPDGTISVPADVTMAHVHSIALNKSWFEINGVKIANTGVGAKACLAYFAVEMRMWSGTHSYCPTTTASWKDVNRNEEEGFIRHVPIEPGNNDAMFLDFMIPDVGPGAGQLPAGTYTICLYVWANFSKYDLKRELEAAGYVNPDIIG